MKLMSNLHMVGFFYLLPCHLFVAGEAVVIHLLIGEKIPGKQLTDFRMTVHTGDTFWMELRGGPHGNARLSGMARKTDRRMSSQRVTHPDDQ
jgi:hypothetical protein